MQWIYRDWDQTDYAAAAGEEGGDAGRSAGRDSCFLLLERLLGFLQARGRRRGEAGGNSVAELREGA